MSITATLNNRITEMAVGHHLPHRAVRVRLTLMYGALFLLSGAALMAIAYALLTSAGFVFTLQGGTGNVPLTGPPATLPGKATSAAGLPGLGAKTHPSAQTMAHWRGVAECMREHGVAGFPNPSTSFPNGMRGTGFVGDREGAIFAIPSAIISHAGPAYERAEEKCGFSPGHITIAQDERRRAQARNELLIQSGIALAGMSLLSLGLGWLMAGRVLQPLRDSYEAQRQFVANASHELRAPLTRQRALIEVALADPDASLSSLRAAHKRVLASEQHLEQMIDGLLALARGQGALERRERLDLAALADVVLATRGSEAADHGLDVHATLAEAPVVGDPRLIERLIANLIENAMRHNLAGGHVKIETGRRDRHAFVSVVNSGPTIPADELPRLLEPFQRLHGARTSHGAGNGLGLAIVSAIAAAHRAKLTAKPRPGGGLAIEVAFLAAAPAPEQDPASAPRPALRAGAVHKS
jgi:signal transduction histidine kinase